MTIIIIVFITSIISFSYLFYQIIKKIIGGKNKVYFINFFIAIYFIGIVVISY